MAGIPALEIRRQRIIWIELCVLSLVVVMLWAGSAWATRTEGVPPTATEVMHDFADDHGLPIQARTQLSRAASRWLTLNPNLHNDPKALRLLCTQWLKTTHVL